MSGNRASSRYQDGKRKSSMTHAKHAHVCRCGRVVMGNGYYSHRKACRLAGEARRSPKNLIAPQRDANLSSSPSPSQDPETP